MKQSKKQIIVVGAGFGGLQVIRHLANNPNIEVTVIDRTNHHLFQPLLYQVASSVLSSTDIAFPIRSLTSSMKNVRVILGQVSAIDLKAKNLQVDNQTFSWDYLVLAFGGVTGYFGHKTWMRHAIGLKSLKDALAIRNRILLSFELAERYAGDASATQYLSFIVIGGGPTGVEMAGAIAELARHILRKDFRKIDPAMSRVILVEAGPRLLPSFSSQSAKEARRKLERRGVAVLLNTRVEAISKNNVTTSAGRLKAHNIIWAAGVEANHLTKTLGVKSDRGGRVFTDSFCAIPGHPNAFVIGDAAAFQVETQGRTQILPGVSPVAMQQGRFVAKLIKKEIKGKPRSGGFKFTDKGSMATIGRKDAVAEIGKLKLSGLVGWLTWLLVHLVYQVGFKNKISILLSWIWSYLRFKAGARLIQESLSEKKP